MSDRLIHLYQRFRRLQYRFLSNNSNVEGRPNINQPTQFVGKGRITFKGNVNLGYFPSPFYLNGYIYLEARSTGSVIEIEDGVWINNNSFIISDGPGVFIGKNTLLGANCEIMDSDFHDTHPERRSDSTGARTGKVVIEENVMIGSNVKILRGVRVGKNTIIANGTVVTRSVPENVIVFGNPAKVGMPLATEPSVA